MQLTIEEIRHIAKLARIGMTEEELEQMRSQMSNILENFQVLQQINTENIEMDEHAKVLGSVARVDHADKSAPLEDTLANAPRQEGSFIKIRPVLE